MDKNLIGVLFLGRQNILLLYYIILYRDLKEIQTHCWYNL